MIRMRVNLSELFTYVLTVPFLLILLFGFTLAYFNNPEVSGAATLAIIDLIYLAKKLLLFVCFCLCFLRKRVPVVSLLAVVVVALAVMGTYVFSAKQFGLFMDIYLDFFCGLVCFLLLFGGIVQVEQLMSVATVVGRVLLVLCIVSLISLPNMEYYVSRNYMTVSNAFLMPVAVLFYSIWRKGHLWDYFLVVVGLLYILLYGSRGGFLTLSVLGVIILCLKTGQKQARFLFLVIPALILGAVWIMQSGILSNSDSRTLQKIFEGELLENSGRFEIWSYLLSRSLSVGLIGRGLCTDRLYLSELYVTNEQVYAHNFFIELLTDFGLIGLFAGIAVVVILVSFFRRCKQPQTRISVLVFVFTSFLQLMFSRTFLTEAGFYVMLAVVLRWWLYERKTEGEKRGNEKGFCYYTYL